MTKENETPNAGAAYQVGPGKPPKETQWKPGQSGNPRGRPKAPSLRELFLRAATQRAGGSAGDATRLESVMHHVLETGALGSRFNTRLVLELAREFLPEDQDGVALEGGEYVPPKTAVAREHDLARFLGYDPTKIGEKP